MKQEIMDDKKRAVQNKNVMHDSGRALKTR